MQDQINTLIEAIKTDYDRWSDRRPNDGYGDIKDKMVLEFNEGLTVKAGKKYIKIMSNSSVWGFVVNVDNDKQFRKGDLLKAASWAAPARNFARGNILDGGYNVQWTGS